MPAFRSYLRAVLPLLRPHWRRELEVLGYVLVLMAYDRALPLGARYLVDTVIPSRSLSQLASFILVLLVIYVVSPVVGIRRAYVSARINQRILNDLQAKVFDSLQRLSHSFYGRSKVGDIALRLSNDLQSISEAVRQSADVAPYWSLSGLVTIVILLVLKPQLAAAVLVTVPLAVAGILYFSTWFQRVDGQLRALAVESMSFLLEYLSAHPIVKAFGMEDRAVASYRVRLVAIRTAAERLNVIEALIKESTVVATTIGELVVLGYGGYLTIEGQLTLGTLLAFIGLLPTLFTPVQKLADVNWAILKGSGALRRVLELVHEPATISDRPGAAPLPPLVRDIRLEHVSAYYGGTHPVLRDLSINIPAGAHVAIVGPSGSGKSTLVNLLMRFWDPEEGRVLFDGKDVRNVTLNSLRGQIGLAFSDSFVFDATARQNIAVSHPDAPDSAIEAAATAARLNTYLTALPSGYDTILGTYGVRLSSGQQQRLSIARALLRDPRVLILDETTSALDAQTEREILDTLAVFAHGRTLINITHRLAIAALADRILVLEQGRLVEEGSHADLIKSGGLYQRLYDEQIAYGAGGRDRIGVEEARLRAIPLFESLSDADLGEVATLLTRERHGSGVDVISQYDEADKFYIIGRGQVDVIVATGSDGAPERRVDTLNEGDYFGEMALLTGAPRNATVRTTIATELFVLERADFLSLLDREPSVRRAVATQVAARQAGLDAIVR